MIMNKEIGFIVKVFLLSLAIALLIKGAAGFVKPEGNSLTALVIVLTPSLVIAVILAIRGSKNRLTI
jgi:hypothetical protein